MGRRSGWSKKMLRSQQYFRWYEIVVAKGSSIRAQAYRGAPVKANSRRCGVHRTFPGTTSLPLPPISCPPQPHPLTYHHPLYFVAPATTVVPLTRPTLAVVPAPSKRVRVLSPVARAHLLILPVPLLLLSGW